MGTGDSGWGPCFLVMSDLGEKERELYPSKQYRPREGLGPQMKKKLPPGAEKHRAERGNSLLGLEERSFRRNGKTSLEIHPEKGSEGYNHRSRAMGEEHKGRKYIEACSGSLSTPNYEL